MRLAAVAFKSILAALTLSGCASNNVALVTDNEQHAPEVWDNLSHLIGQDRLDENDRLVLLRISHKNSLEFRNEIDIRQYPKSPSGRSFLTLYPHDKAGDMLVLIKFKPDAGNTAYLQVMPCNSSSNTWCVYTQSSDESHLKIALPPPGETSYAGHLDYAIVDEFPDRGTQNQPRVVKLSVTNDFDKDLKAALTKWPLLKGRKVINGIASVQSGRAKVFIMGSSEANN